MKYLIVLIILIYSANIHGQEINREELNKELSMIQSEPLVYNGKDGVWFSNEDAELLLNLVSVKLKTSFDIIDKQSIQINALKTSIDSCNESNKAYIELANVNKQMLDTTMKNIPNIIPPQEPWYKASEAMFVYGMITGGVIIFGTTLLAIQAIGAQSGTK